MTDHIGPADAFAEAASTNSYFQRWLTGENLRPDGVGNWYATGGYVAPITDDDGDSVSVLIGSGCQIVTAEQAERYGLNVDARRLCDRDDEIHRRLNAPVDIADVSLVQTHADTDDNGTATV